MFLRYLSSKNYEERYSFFVFRAETFLAGFLQELAKSISSLTQEQAKNFLETCFAQCFSQQQEQELLTLLKTELPSIDWFWDYFDHEFPYMIQETQRIAREKDFSKTPDFDLEKIHEYAHHHETFRRQLLALGTTESPAPPTDQASQNPTV